MSMWHSDPDTLLNTATLEYCKMGTTVHSRAWCSRGAAPWCSRLRGPGVGSKTASRLERTLPVRTRPVSRCAATLYERDYKVV